MSASAGMDARLVQAVQAGDELAFETLFLRYQPKVYRQAWSLLGDQADAEDVTQEVFLKLHQKAGMFRGTSTFATWLYRITANAALTRLRCRKRRDLAFEHVPPAYGTDRTRAQNVEHQAMRAEADTCLRQALEALHPLDRVVVILSDLEGLTNRETGDVLGLSLPAVKARRYRAHQALKERLSKLLFP